MPVQTAIDKAREAVKLAQSVKPSSVRGVGSGQSEENKTTHELVAAIETLGAAVIELGEYLKNSMAGVS